MSDGTGANALDSLIYLSKSVENHKFYYSTATKSQTIDSLENENAIHLINNNDPLSSIINNGLDENTLTTIFIDEWTLLRALPQFYTLTNLPIIFNVDLNFQDYSIAAALKDLAFPILISSDLDAFVRNAQKSIEIATQTSTPLLHFINYKNMENKKINLKELNLDIKKIEVEEKKTIHELHLDYFKLYSKNVGSAENIIINLSAYANEFINYLPTDTALIDIYIYRPWNLDLLFELIPKTVKKIVVVQNSNSESTFGIEPALLDFFADFNKLVERNIDQLIISNVSQLINVNESLQSIINNLKSDKPNERLFSGTPYATDSENVKLYISAIENAINLEDAYLKVLKQLFGSNLNIFNEFNSANVQENNPEYGFGRFLNSQHIRETLVTLAKQSLDINSYDFDAATDLVKLLSKWIQFNSVELSEETLSTANEVGKNIYEILLQNKNSEGAKKFLSISNEIQDYTFKLNWLIGSDAWSYDLGNSGIHQVIASKKNINVLLIDSEPYDKIKNSTAKDRKKDVGLYAMNYANVYVASVAVYASYTQLLSALIEASKFNGPSIVLAYLPYHSENETPLEILKETKIAVESGYWPLYRYDPSKEKETEIFSLDSSVIRNELQKFLDRENKLSLLAQKSPDFARNLKDSASDLLTKKQNARAKRAFDQLLEGLSGPPLHIYYASDGGNATALAKKLGNRAAARGLKSSVSSMDDIIIEELPNEENVIFVTSTAGQGELPQDGKAFWDQIKSTLDLDLASVNFSVFGLGDSQYWPRKEDAHYYNKPAKDIFKRLELLSAKPIIPLGLGDDQDADGFQTGYKEWEASLWEALGVSGAAVADEPKELTNEDMKLGSNYLRGTIKEGLADQSTGALCAVDQQLTKFHGFYMQDDRDIRETRKSQGLEPYYSFMVRCRLPGGKVTPEQWLVLDSLADNNGVGTLKITTRATIQLHGVIKKDIKHTLRAINSTLLDTVAACGDVNRNVTVASLPGNAKVHKQVSQVAHDISEFFLPRTTAYHEIWLQGNDDRDLDPSWPSKWENRKEGPNKKKTLIAGNALVDVEPLLGQTYLPRKFKINIAIPPYNDVDVWSSDVGLIAIIDKDQNLKGFNMYVGGGMGTTHNNKKTYPRTGSSFGFVKTEDIFKAIEAVIILQRDHGDRQNRKHARLKYTIDDMTVPVFKKKTEELFGKVFEPEQPFEITSNIDYFGWVKDETGLNHCTMYIENGRVVDTADLPQKTGLRKLARLLKEWGSGHFRLTANQHLLVDNIDDTHLDEVKELMKKYKLDNTNFSGLRLSSSACVAFPSCGLAMAESERYLPVLITKIEDILEEYGLRHDSIIMRMTGCGNGCSRPWLAELALVGKAPGTYNLLLGGSYNGERLNKLYRASIKEDEILSIIKPLFKKWSLERYDGEHFGDFLIRDGVIKPTTEGKYFHDDLPEGAL
ncbi:hypothetical protein TPHA_0L00200 [Tetrapisispora phaffii CBS 4417]|uniref:Sulfite reductase [NADPH] subunit beta n=1 Tax=Tetrapisispora phaffii (strain ATCC 24235 / CBS 4417 / NBRC 1672 / NRRL Y-8282 / UCD 70-5) TaxID=1071381 RepID=G8BZP9_TETPH|nr:hypothetical protein TPHA_0L00200 [Tetrapisispora phaffii CBS 4417]CCE65377.1 hypothetical protein TPHA_0L00200 [Tetrapisispora phaffii CBS 4417]